MLIAAPLICITYERERESEVTEGKDSVDRKTIIIMMSTTFYFEFSNSSSAWLLHGIQWNNSVWSSWVREKEGRLRMKTICQILHRKRTRAYIRIYFESYNMSTLFRNELFRIYWRGETYWVTVQNSKGYKLGWVGWRMWEERMEGGKKGRGRGRGVSLLSSSLMIHSLPTSRRLFRKEGNYLALLRRWSEEKEERAMQWSEITSIEENEREL